MDLSIKINDLIEDITDLYVSVTDNLLKVIYNPDPVRAKRIFKRILDQSNFDYCEYEPLTLTKYVTDSNYTFKDNFLDVIQGKEVDLEMPPEGILNISQGGVNFTTKNQFAYDKRTGLLQNGLGLVTYAVRYPYILNGSDTKEWKFSDDSIVYGVTSYEDFRTQLAYEILDHITRNRSLLQLQTGIPTLDFTYQLEYLKTKIDQNEIYSEEVYKTWANAVDNGSNNTSMFNIRFDTD